MKKFMIKLLILVVPFAICWGILEYVGRKTGELKTVPEIIQLQEKSEGEFLIGMAYSGQQKFIDLYHVNKEKPKCIALGTSRVMQYKSFCFQNSDEFYNTGGSVAENFDEYKNFLMNLDDENLDCIILGLDSWVFNEEWNSKNCGDYSQYKELIYNSELNRKSIYHGMIEDYFDGKWSVLSVLKSKNNIGMSGIVRNSGYMKDGSYYYGNLYTNPEMGDDYQFVDTFDRIENAGGRFEYGTEIYDKTLEKLDDLLAYCSENGIEVIGFIPPYAPSVYDKMMESGNYQYTLNIYEKCSPLFEKYGFTLKDYQDIQNSFACDDSYFVDGFHGSEVLYGMILKDLAESNEKLSFYVDENKIEELLKDKYSNVIFYEPLH